MRIIAGEWKGRRLRTPTGLAVRPTPDRVREAWMSIVQLAIPGARVLDLCAGTGALGLEALSRGAEHADFVEHDAASVRLLEENAELLHASSRCTTHLAEAAGFVSRLPAHAYPLAFADPPYRRGIAAELASLWLRTPFATIFGVEHEARALLPDGDDCRHYGDTAVTFYRA